MHIIQEDKILYRLLWVLHNVFHAYPLILSGAWPQPKCKFTIPEKGILEEWKENCSNTWKIKRYHFHNQFPWFHMHESHAWHKIVSSCSLVAEVGTDTFWLLFTAVKGNLIYIRVFTLELWSFQRNAHYIRRAVSCCACSSHVIWVFMSALYLFYIMNE